MPIDVDGTKLTSGEATTLTAMINLQIRLGAELRGLEVVMADTEFIRRCDLILDICETLDRDFCKEIKNWKRDVNNQ